MLFISTLMVIILFLGHPVILSDGMKQEESCGLFQTKAHDATPGLAMQFTPLGDEGGHRLVYDSGGIYITKPQDIKAKCENTQKCIGDVSMGDEGGG